MPAGRMTKHQRAVIEALASDGGLVSVPRLAELVGAPKEGAAMTAASLVRRGLVVRERVGGRVHFGMAGAARSSATLRAQAEAVERARALHNRDVQREEESASRCRYCGRGPGLGVFLSPGLDPQWDGDGDVCTVCFDLRSDGWSWNGVAWIDDDHGAGCDGPLNCVCGAVL